MAASSERQHWKSDERAAQNTLPGLGVPAEAGARDTCFSGRRAQPSARDVAACGCFPVSGSFAGRGERRFREPQASPALPTASGSSVPSSCASVARESVSFPSRLVMPPSPAARQPCGAAVTLRGAGAHGRTTGLCTLASLQDWGRTSVPSEEGD